MAIYTYYIYRYKYKEIITVILLHPVFQMPLIQQIIVKNTIWFWFIYSTRPYQTVSEIKPIVIIIVLGNYTVKITKSDKKPIRHD